MGELSAGRGRAFQGERAWGFCLRGFVIKLWFAHLLCRDSQPIPKRVQQTKEHIEADFIDFDSRLNLADSGLANTDELRQLLLR